MCLSASSDLRYRVMHPRFTSTSLDLFFFFNCLFSRAKYFPSLSISLGLSARDMLDVESKQACGRGVLPEQRYLLPQMQMYLLSFNTTCRQTSKLIFILKIIKVCQLMEIGPREPCNSGLSH
jgi:hypothetical protein